MPDAPTDAGETRPRRRRRWMALAVFALALSLTFWARSALDGWVRQSLELLVEDKLGGQLTFGHFRLELLGLRATFSEMELRLPRADGESWLLAVKSGRVRLKPESLLGLPARRIRLSELELEEPRLDWERSRRDAEPRRRGLGPRPFDLEIERLELRNGRLLFTDDARPWSFNAREVGLRARWNARAGALVGDASLQVELRGAPFFRPLDLTLRSDFELRRYGIVLEDQNRLHPFWEERAKPGIMSSAEIQNLPL